MVGWAADPRNPAGSQDDDLASHDNARSHAVTTDVSATSMRTVKNFPLPFGSGYYVPDRYAIPTHLLREMFRTIDRRDSPAQPGRLKYSTALYAINHFHGIFSETGTWTCPKCGEKQFRLNSNCRNCNAPVPADAPGRETKLNSDVAASLQRLATQAQRHQRRVSSRNLDEVTLRWNQGDVLNCFQVELNLKERIFFTFDISENSTFCSKSVSWIIMLAVLISILTFIISTLPSADNAFGGWIPWVDVACVTLFTVDYLTRLLTVSFARSELLDRHFIEAAISGHEEISLMSAPSRLKRFLISPMAIVDLISVLPFWIEFAVVGPNDLFKTDADDETSSGVLRVFRVVRIIRVFKLGTLAKADLGEDNNMVVNLFGEVVGKARPALQLVLVLVILAMLVFGTLIWFTERGTLFKQNDPDCPHANLCSSGSVRIRKTTDGSYEDSESPFTSIPLSFWWVVVTITTVGYGDYFPVTTLGLPIGGICIFYGVVVFALPVGIIGSTFGQAYDNFVQEQRVRKALEMENHHKESGHRAGLEEDRVDMDTFDPREPPPLVEELLIALKQTGVAAQLREDMLTRWETSLRKVTKFEHFTEEHPCESLERWGQPVLATLCESVENIPLAQKFFAQTRGAWYRLLLHAAQAYEDFQESLRPAEFVASMHGPLRQGSVKLSVDPKLLDKASSSFCKTNSLSSGVGKSMAARLGSDTGVSEKQMI